MIPFTEWRQDDLDLNQRLHSLSLLYYDLEVGYMTLKDRLDSVELILFKLLCSDRFKGTDERIKEDLDKLEIR